MMADFPHNGKREFHVHLNMTRQCNFRCAYCVETGLFKSKTFDPLVPKFFEWMDRFLASDVFKENFKCITLCFWGGEPTLEWKSIVKILERFRRDNRVQFMLYTNGSRMPPELGALLIDMAEARRRNSAENAIISAQVSYDGAPIHDMLRKTVAGKPTADLAKATVNWMRENGVPFSTKATITLETLKYMHEAWKDVSELCGTDHKYFPTLDYYNDMTPEQRANLDEYIEDMKTSMKKIAADSLKAKREGKPVAPFRWFDESKDKCAAGQVLFALDVDGKFYSCHTALYSALTKDHLTGDIDDDFSIFLTSATKHEGERPAACENCQSVFCIRCNVSKYAASKKETFIDRWMDFTGDDDQCRIYKEMGMVTRAYLQLSEKI